MLEPGTTVPSWIFAMKNCQWQYVLDGMFLAYGAAAFGSNAIIILQRICLCLAKIDCVLFVHLLNFPA